MSSATLSLRPCHASTTLSLRPARCHYDLTVCSITRSRRPIRSRHAATTTNRISARSRYAVATHLPRSQYDLVDPRVSRARNSQALQFVINKMPVKGNKIAITAITTKEKGRGKGSGTPKSRTPAAGVDSRVVDVPYHARLNKSLL